MKRWIIIAAAVVAALFAWRVFASGGETESAEFRLAAIDRGDVVRSVSATGRLEPLGAVEVGSQLSGEIVEILADYNDRVEAGAVIARLDPATFDQRARVNEADLAVQRANLIAAEAQLASTEADLRDAEGQYARQLELQRRGIASEAALATSLAARDRARAAVATAQANIVVATARVTQAEATLAGSQIDLERTNIRSPVDGVVVDRSVEVGQTVAASLQAPILFVIAEDLSRMQVEIQVDEADIGEVRAGLPVRFSVDAFVDQSFEGEVTQVRMQPLIEQNVVTYTVIAETANTRGRLLPGMTANVEIVLEERAGVLRAPNAALRWRPAETVADAPAAGRGERGRRGGPGGRIDRVVAELDLSETQRAEVEPILDDARRAARAAMAATRDGGGDRGAARAEMARAMDAAFERIAPLLSDAQRETLERVRAQAGERGRGSARPGVVWTLARRDAARPVRVRLGASDAERTEIVEVIEGALEEGDQVIVGGGEVERAPEPVRRGRGRGLRGL